MPKCNFSYYSTKQGSYKNNELCVGIHLLAFMNCTGGKTTGGPEKFCTLFNDAFIKVKLSLCSARHHTTRKCISMLDGGEWSVLRLCYFIWVDHSAGLEDVQDRKISCPCRESNTDSPASSRRLY
jgi:hypothetical protein